MRDIHRGVVAHGQHSGSSREARVAISRDRIRVHRGNHLLAEAQRLRPHLLPGRARRVDIEDEIARGYRLSRISGQWRTGGESFVLVVFFADPVRDPFRFHARCLAAIAAVSGPAARVEAHVAADVPAAAPGRCAAAAVSAACCSCCPAVSRLAVRAAQARQDEPAVDALSPPAAHAPAARGPRLAPAAAAVVSPLAAADAAVARLAPGAATPVGSSPAGSAAARPYPSAGSGSCAARAMPAAQRCCG